MYSIENPVGRLIVARLASPFSADEMDGLVRQTRMLVLALPARAVSAVDMRGLEVFRPDLAEAFTTMLTRDNPKVERTAFLLARQRGAIAMQLERMLREANHPARRTFVALDDLLAFVDPVLSVAERAAARTFFAAP